MGGDTIALQEKAWGATLIRFPKPKLLQALLGGVLTRMEGQGVVRPPGLRIAKTSSTQKSYKGARRLGG